MKDINSLLHIKDGIMNDQLTLKEYIDLFTGQQEVVGRNNSPQVEAARNKSVIVKPFSVSFRGATTVFRPLQGLFKQPFQRVVLIIYLY